MTSTNGQNRCFSIKTTITPNLNTAIRTAHGNTDISKTFSNIAKKFWRDPEVVFQTYWYRGILQKCHGNTFCIWPWPTGSRDQFTLNKNPALWLDEGENIFDMQAVSIEHNEGQSVNCGHKLLQHEILQEWRPNTIEWKHLHVAIVVGWHFWTFAFLVDWKIVVETQLALYWIMKSYKSCLFKIHILLWSSSRWTGRGQTFTGLQWACVASRGIWPCPV